VGNSTSYCDGKVWDAIAAPNPPLSAPVRAKLETMGFRVVIEGSGESGKNEPAQPGRAARLECRERARRAARGDGVELENGHRIVAEAVSRSEPSLSREQIAAIYLCGMTLAESGAVELSLTMSFGRITLLRLDEGRVLLARPQDQASAALVAALICYPMFFASAPTECG
jgi:hypothetical protein